MDLKTIQPVILLFLFSLFHPSPAQSRRSLVLPPMRSAARCRWKTKLARPKPIVLLVDFLYLLITRTGRAARNWTGRLTWPKFWRVILARSPTRPARCGAATAWRIIGVNRFMVIIAATTRGSCAATRKCWPMPAWTWSFSILPTRVRIRKFTPTCAKYSALCAGRVIAHRKLLSMVNTRARETATEIYHTLYQPGRYPASDMWFIWQGKPLMICDPAEATDELRKFFTLRAAHWPFTLGSTSLLTPGIGKPRIRSRTATPTTRRSRSR